MASPKPITIIGGGLAGLTLGIGLRQREIPVMIQEAGSYPRHRVCGEFISGGGQTVLERLGLLEHLQKAGAIYARTVMFICDAAQSPVRPLAAPALCLSRYKMDALLAERFQQLGGLNCCAQSPAGLQITVLKESCPSRPPPPTSGKRCALVWRQSACRQYHARQS